MRCSVTGLHVAIRTLCSPRDGTGTHMRCSVTGLHVAIRTLCSPRDGTGTRMRCSVCVAGPSPQHSCGRWGAGVADTWSSLTPCRTLWLRTGNSLLVIYLITMYTGMYRYVM